MNDIESKINFYFLVKRVFGDFNRFMLEMFKLRSVLVRDCMLRLLILGCRIKSVRI